MAGKCSAKCATHSASRPKPCVATAMHSASRAANPRSSLRAIRPTPASSRWKSATTTAYRACRTSRRRRVDAHVDAHQVLGFARMIRPLLIPIFCACIALCGSARAEMHPGEDALVREVVADTGQDGSRLTALLDGAQYRQSIIDAMTRPAEAKPWSEYRPIFVNPARIDNGIDFYRENRVLLDRVSEQYGVPPQYLVAILGVETNYGQITGHYRVLDALVTLAFHYPPRADYFRGELKTLLELPVGKLAGPVATLQGSYAGAQGWGQFMPSSIRDFAVDEDGDGHIDLNGSLPDIL